MEGVISCEIRAVSGQTDLAVNGWPVWAKSRRNMTYNNPQLAVRQVVAKSRARSYFSTAFGFVARFSSNSQLVTQQMPSSWIHSKQIKSTNQFAAFLQPATNVFVPRQWSWSRKVKLETSTQNLLCNKLKIFVSHILPPEAALTVFQGLYFSFVEWRIRLPKLW